MKLLLEGGRVVDPASGLDGVRDVLIEDGAIAAIDRGIGAGRADEVLDCAGLVVCPGFVDIHTHLREPGQEWKEDVTSGTRAAAAGGFVAVACMANTDPLNDNRSVTERILRASESRGVVPVHPIGAVTKGMGGEELVEMDDMLEAGAVAFSDDMNPVANSLMMRKALEYARVFGVPIVAHCEDRKLVDGGVVHEGEISTRLGLPGWPSIAEEIGVHRDLLIAEYTRGHLHVAHVSTGRAVGYIREAKSRGVRVTCEATPHHLTLTEDALVGYDTNLKMNPPLRSRPDVERLREALADGTIDAIVSDHAPHHPDEKAVEFSLAPPGVIGLETAVAVCLDRLVHGDVIDLARLVELFTVGPARILRLDRGRLAVGRPADVTVLDLERRTVVRAAEGFSKSRNTPFEGMELRGGPVLTVAAGRVVHDARATAVSAAAAAPSATARPAKERGRKDAE